LPAFLGFLEGLVADSRAAGGYATDRWVASWCGALCFLSKLMLAVDAFLPFSMTWGCKSLSVFALEKRLLRMNGVEWG
jgi:hypothetical protein